MQLDRVFWPGILVDLVSIGLIRNNERMVALYFFNLLISVLCGNLGFIGVLNNDV